MKHSIYLFTATCMLLFGCKTTEKGMKITVSNPSDFARLAEVVEIPLDSVTPKIPLAEGKYYVVKNAAGAVLPSQVTHDGKLIFAPELAAGEKKTFSIGTDTMHAYTPKVWGRLMPERFDDFAWENDRVAFRIYAQALVKKDGPSNGLDIWYKYVPEFIMEKKVAAENAHLNSYHNDNGDGGMDNYDVGHSLGAGAAAPYVDGKLWLNDNFISAKVLDYGALRITFELIYNDLDVNGTKISEKRIISLDAGSQLTKIQQFYGNTAPMSVAAGIVKVAGNDAVTENLSDGYLIYSVPDNAKAQGVFVGVLLPAGIEKVVPDAYDYFNPVKKQKAHFEHNLALTAAQPNIPLTYYSGYGWSRYGFADLAAFQQYMKNFADGLKNPLTVKY